VKFNIKQKFLEIPNLEKITENLIEKSHIKVGKFNADVKVGNKPRRKILQKL
jgi:hypothetical protein